MLCRPNSREFKIFRGMLDDSKEPTVTRSGELNRGS